MRNPRRIRKRHNKHYGGGWWMYHLHELDLRKVSDIWRKIIKALEASLLQCIKKKVDVQTLKKDSHGGGGKVNDMWRQMKAS